MSEETLCLQALGRLPPAIIDASDRGEVSESENKTSLKQASITPPSPPDRVDLLLDIIEIRQALKELLDQVSTGTVKATKELSAQIYIMQQIVYTNKTALDALKEPITVTQNNITQIKHVVKFVKPTAKPDNTDD